MPGARKFLGERRIGRCGVSRVAGISEELQQKVQQFIGALNREERMLVVLKHELYEGDWEAVRKDLGRRPLDNTDEASTTDDIINALSKHGVFPAHIELWGTGRPMREFLWSEDMADACVFIMENVNFDDLKQDKKEVRNCHINIGTGKEISIKNLAETIRKIIGYKGEIRFDASKPDGTMRKLTDVSKLTSLGWQYNVEIGEGIGRMYNWYVTDQE